MTTPPNPPPPPASPPPPGGYGAAPPPPGPGAPGAPAKKSSLPVISLVLGLLSVTCLGFIAGIAAIITGFMGRSRSKQTGEGGGMSLAGIILGFIGSIMSVVLLIIVFAGGFALFNAASKQVTVAEELNPASQAAQAYGAQNGTYAGISTEALSAFGYIPSNEVEVTAVPLRGGASYCIEGEIPGESSSRIHVPVSGGNVVNLEINGVEYRYSLGGCPTS